ncbi:putative oxidoreductase [Senna tora]|uniref:Putative oxidoreductase n=1 Tax=Senna tora TaxID=362788 RepID=A0A834SUA5_9FABA|nr:putative oxidoreductase [Senna tora]
MVNGLSGVASTVDWKASNLVSDILSLFLVFSSVRFSWIRRSGNLAANWLAKAAVKGMCPDGWVVRPPSPLASLLKLDRVGGVIIGDYSLATLAITNGGALSEDERKRVMSEPYELGEECVETNYYGAKRTVEALLPLLQLSHSPRIVNVSSSMGTLKMVSNEWARGVLSDVEKFTEERINEVVKEFLKDFKEGSHERKRWPKIFAAYVVSKAALNAYTRILAMKYPKICINCLCPGYVKTDINGNTGILTVKEGASKVVRLALLPNGSPSGLFYSNNKVSHF